MISEERMFRILIGPHISEKSSILTEKFNTVILKVLKNASKYEIKYAIQKIFNIEIENIQTVYMKGKKKRQSNRVVFRQDWKKAYIKIKKGQSLDFIGTIE